MCAQQKHPPTHPPTHLLPSPHLHHPTTTTTTTRELFSSLDRCEEILKTQEYIAGNQLTEADVRLFMTLIRFDEVYVVYFKTNKKFIHEYPRLKVWGVGCGGLGVMGGVR